MKHSVQITVQQHHHRTAPDHDVLALSKILNIGRWQTRNLAGWAARSVELVRSGLPKAEIWRLRRWWIAWEIRGRWLAMAAVHLLRKCSNISSCNKFIRSPLDLTRSTVVVGALLTRQRGGGYAQSCSISAKAGFCVLFVQRSQLMPRIATSRLAVLASDACSHTSARRAAM